MPILNYTTQIRALKTVGEIQQILAKGGAKQILIDFESGQPSSIKFQIDIQGQPIFYQLPCNTQGVYKSLCRSKAAARLKTMEQARRVAWRIIKDWIEAQMAIVEAGQAELAEVFLPYAMVSGGQTVYHVFLNQKQLLLGGEK